MDTITIPGMSYEKILVLNDQGGAFMSITEDVVNTLRAQDHGHPPTVMVFESHNIDCRYRLMGDICETVTYYGTGGV